MIRNTLAVDDLDYRLTSAINASYGIGITNATPRVTGAVIPKIQVGGLHTTNIQIYGSVQTPLRLMHELTTESGDLVLTATTGRIDFGGASFANYTTPPQNFVDLTYQGVSPDPPMSNTLRIYANSGGLLAWKAPSGIISRLDSSGLSANRTFTLPDADSEIVGTDATQELTNKIIDSASNTVRIGGVAVGSLIGQDVRTGASPAFVSLGLTGRLSMDTGATHPVTINQSSSTTGNDVMFQRSGVNVFSIGTNETSNEIYTWVPAARDYGIRTNSIERVKLLSSGISTDNTTINVLGLQGAATLVYKTTVADTSSSQVFTNKTIDSASNTVRIGGVAVGSLIGQDVRTSASPTFNTFSTVGSFSEFGSKITTIHGAITTTDGNFARIVTTTIPMPSNVTRIMVVYVMAFCSAGANLNGSVGHRVIVRITTTGGSMDIAQTSSLSSNTFPSNLTITDQGGGIVGVRITGIAANTIRWIAYAEIYDES